MKISVAFIFIITAISAIVSNVKGSIEEEFQKAFDSVDPDLHKAFENLGGGPISNWLNGFKKITKCIEEEIGTPDLCCAKGTLVQKVIEKFVKSIPHTGIMTGIPPKVSKDRCLSVLPSIISLPFKL